MFAEGVVEVIEDLAESVHFDTRSRSAGVSVSAVPTISGYLS